MSAHKKIDPKILYDAYVRAGHRLNIAALELGVADATIKLGVQKYCAANNLPWPKPQPWTPPEVSLPQAPPMLTKGPAPNTVRDAPAAEQWDERVKAIIRRKPCTLDALAEELGASRGQVLDTIDRLRQSGLNLFEHSGLWSWDKDPAPGHVRSDIPEYVSNSDGWLRFGFCSDNHLCSKYARLDVLNDLYDKFAAAKVDRVLNAGNWIDGEARFNKHDLLEHGMRRQLKYLAEHYPQRPGIVTYAVAGDDHEGWYCQREGVNIGLMAENAMREVGRTDWVDLGYMEAFIQLLHAETRQGCMLHLMHPGGGTAYAISYTVQKIVEGYDGGEKPAILLAGHYHKLNYQVIRNVHTVQTGCTQDQTPFARKKKISFNLGGGIAEVKLDRATGAVERFKLEIFPYFVRSFYNGRWSLSDDVVHADRGVEDAA